MTRFSKERWRRLAGLLNEGSLGVPSLIDADKLPNIGPPEGPQQDVMPKKQILEELTAVLAEVLSETADEAWYAGAEYLADALRVRIEEL